MMHLKDYQRKLFPYAYNILGSYDDAQDVIQDILIKYHLTDKTNIENESNYLIKGVINQSINIKKKNSKTVSSKVTLPEPISTDYADSNIARKEILSYSLLVLLDSLNARERAVFILKEAFDYSHSEIAKTLQITIENSRKLFSRSKLRLGSIKQGQKHKEPVSPDNLEKYIIAIQSGNIKNLEKMLAKDISVTTDGGNISIVADVARGINTVAQLMAYVYQTYQKNSNIKTSLVNHMPALLFYNNDELVNCQIFDVDQKTKMIKNIYSVVDPEKLKNFEKNS